MMESRSQGQQVSRQERGGKQAWRGPVKELDMEGQVGQRDGL